MKDRAFWIVLCFIYGIGCVWAVYAVSNRVYRTKNGFVRQFPPHVAMPKRILDLKYSNLYICGISNEKIYLAYVNHPDQLIEVDTGLMNMAIHPLNIMLGDRKLAAASRLYVNPPAIYLMDGITGAVYSGKLGEYIMHHAFATPNFTLAQPVKGSIILRAFNNTLGRNVLLNVSAAGSTEKNNILESQVDGLFSTDGLLNYDPLTNKLVYVYYYRNQFICMDSSQNIIYKGKTIDTVAKVKFSVDTIHSQGQVTISSPPLMVNQRSCINSKYLFINSALAANNEDAEDQRDYAAVDIYNLSDGSYNCSCYIPRYMKQKFREFRVNDDMLFAIYDHYLYAYDLHIKKRW